MHALVASLTNGPASKLGVIAHCAGRHAVLFGDFVSRLSVKVATVATFRSGISRFFLLFQVLSTTKIGYTLGRHIAPADGVLADPGNGLGLRGHCLDQPPLDSLLLFRGDGAAVG